MKLFTHLRFIKSNTTVICIFFALNSYGQWGGSTGAPPSMPSGLQFHGSGSGGGSSGGGGGLAGV